MELTKRVLIGYLSTSRGSRRILEVLQEGLRGHFLVERAPILPSVNHGRLVWGLLSIIPGLGTKIGPVQDDLREYDLLILITPKWTNSCPPITSYLKNLKNLDGKSVAIVLHCHGFGYEPYLKSLQEGFERKGAQTLHALVIKSSQLASGELGQLEDLLLRIRSELSTGVEARTDCKHNYVFHGMINVRERDELIGAVDVWECSHCHNSDVLDRRVGQERSEGRTTGFRLLGPGERWGILVCRASAHAEWRVVRVRPGEVIPCECELTGLEKVLQVNYDMSLSGIGGGEAMGHRLHLVEDWIWKNLELISRTTEPTIRSATWSEH